MAVEKRIQTDTREREGEREREREREGGGLKRVCNGNGQRYTAHCISRNRGRTVVCVTLWRVCVAERNDSGKTALVYHCMYDLFRASGIKQPRR